MLRQCQEYRSDIDAVVVCDEHRWVVADLALFDLLLAPDQQSLAQVMRELQHPAPVVVGTEAEVDEVAAALVESRRSHQVMAAVRFTRSLGRGRAARAVPQRHKLAYP